DAYLTLDAFPDARTALTALKTQGLRLAILSNGTPRMLAAAAEAAGIAGYFDAVLSGDPGRRDKPLPEVDVLATRPFGMPRSDVGFVSSNRWDVMGASSFGFQAYWVNRASMPDEYPDFPPLRRIGDLTALSAA